MSRSSLDDPLVAYNFLVEIDGFSSAGFKELTGLEASAEVIEYREGNQINTSRKTAGIVSYGPITLRRGLNPVSAGAGSFDMDDWFKQVSNSRAGNRQSLEYRRDLDIVYMHRDGTTGARFRLRNAWPSKLALGDAGGDTNDHIIQEMELTHEGYERVT